MMTVRILVGACALTAALALGAPAARAQTRQGSIYNPAAGMGGLISAKTAMRKGDIVTVLIAENQNVQNNEASDLSRSTNLNYKINAFNIAPDAFDPLPSVDADSSDGFIGQAKYQKSGAFNARLAAIVVDSLPNGNLVVSGRREIRIDQETKLIEFTGIVRRWDIEADNTIQSELVANAEIVYRGSGPMTDHTNRYGLGGWLHRIWAWVWPF
jgi:flagellar L-ring protein precursor FlgH